MAAMAGIGERVKASRTLKLHDCETCGQEISKPKFYTVERYNNVRFCSQRCRRDAPIIEVGCALCGAPLKRKHRTGFPHCHPRCPGGVRSQPAPRDALPGEPAASPVEVSAGWWIEPFRPAILRLLLLAIEAEIDWPVFSDQGRQALIRALMGRGQDSESLGPIKILAIEAWREDVIAA